MNIVIIYCKTMQKFIKYSKINKIKKKNIIDISQEMEENEIEYPKDLDYFNTIIFAKVNNILSKGRDVYFFPRYDNDFKLEDILNLQHYLKFDVKMKMLVSFDEIRDDDDIVKNIFANIDKIESQVLKDY